MNGKQYQYAPAAIEEVIALLEKPLGTKPVHRIWPPLAGGEQFSKELLGRLKSQVVGDRGSAAKAIPGHRAYVQSGPDGVFYARCVPARPDGKPAHTDVYRVDGETDTRVDRYDWFAPGGVVLGWSPIKGEVAIMAVTEERRDDWRAQEELRFSSGGRFLKAYTAADLLALGAGEQMNHESGRRGAAFRMVGCEQVPGTNEYDFIVEFAKDRRLRFDITTGKIRPAARS